MLVAWTKVVAMEVVKTVWGLNIFQRCSSQDLLMDVYGV